MLASLALSLHLIGAEPARWDMFYMNDYQHAAAKSDNINAMGNVNYDLPNDLGTLSLTVPSNWVGARANGVEALWIDQNADGFKPNLTLRIHKVSKVNDPEPLLDSAVEKLLSNTAQSPVQGVDKVSGRRTLSFDTEIEGHELRQDTLVLYAENAASSYLVVLTSSDFRGSSTVDLTSIEITNP